MTRLEPQASAWRFSKKDASAERDLALKYHPPVVSGLRESAEAGMLMSYGPNFPDAYRRAAIYVDKILNGTKPSVIPVERSTKFELVINLKKLSRLA